MKIAVLADIHPNFDALQAVLADAEKAGVARFLSLHIQRGERYSRDNKINLLN